MANWVEVTNDDEVRIGLNLDHAEWLYNLVGHNGGATIIMCSGDTHGIKETLSWDGTRWVVVPLSASEVRLPEGL